MTISPSFSNNQELWFVAAAQLLLCRHPDYGLWTTLLSPQDLVAVFYTP